MIRNSKELQEFHEWFLDNIDQIYTSTEPFDLNEWINQSKEKEQQQKPE